jgi:putative membrane protein
MQTLKRNRDNLFWILTAAVAVEWVILAFDVVDRPTWIIENILPLILFVPGVWLYKKNVLSKVSMSLLYFFVALHAIGAHYTYSLVPYDRWFESLTGFKLNPLLGWDRNQYDRCLHFLFGFIIYQPAVEIFRHYTTAIKNWAIAVFVLLLINNFSMTYEMIEWVASLLLDERTGGDFLGAQGDVWDAHKDMVLAFVGSLLAVILFQGLLGRKKRIKNQVSL